MDHFTGVNEQERYNNELLNEIRKTNQLLEQILNKPQTKEATKNVTHPTKRVSVDSPGKGQSGQRGGNSNRNRREQ